MRTDLTSCDAIAAVAEDEAGDQVDPAHNEDHDTRSYDDAPEGKAERFLAGCWFVEVAEHVDTEDDHQERECHEAVSRTEEGPVASVVSLKEGELRRREEHYI